ncbi:hypothetical protein D9611_013449 [Ephemerocybe angulata]|uniref:Uncharacterized protein n=1 Tax=Ephemerocybe angulata TaxID=980116 RepID=A0A8H5BUN1_9AGAR|nr:hypothetical protein D9611_013449 [Tulosesus angulatus]
MVILVVAVAYTEGGIWVKEAITGTEHRAFVWPSPRFFDPFHHLPSALIGSFNIVRPPPDASPTLSTTTQELAAFGPSATLLSPSRPQTGVELNAFDDGVDEGCAALRTKKHDLHTSNTFIIARHTTNSKSSSKAFDDAVDDECTALQGVV